MQNSLASDILKSAKKKATFWKIATAIVLVIAVVEFIAIIF